MAHPLVTVTHSLVVLVQQGGAGIDCILALLLYQCSNRRRLRPDLHCEGGGTDSLKESSGLEFGSSLSEFGGEVGAIPDPNTSAVKVAKDYCCLGSCRCIFKCISVCRYPV